MTITSIKIRRLCADGSRLRAVVSLVLEGCLALHDIKVVQGASRLFVAMPVRVREDGQLQDIAHPITKAFRQQMEAAVLEAYWEQAQE